MDNGWTPFAVFIPARSDSQRLPRKLYEVVEGMSVIEMTWRQAKQSRALAVTIVCKDKEIRDCCEEFGADTWLTDGTERNGTEAIAQATALMPDSAICVNVQGDDCLIPPDAIDQCAELLKGHYQMSTLIAPLDPGKNGLSVCKVEVNHKDEAIYFSRADIPHSKEEGADVLRYTHLGIYGYTVALLKKYITWGKPYLEEVEGLEQLRPIYYGVPIICGRWNDLYHKGVDTQDDLNRVREQAA